MQQLMAPSHRIRRRRRRSHAARGLRTFFAAVVAIALIGAGTWVLQRATAEPGQPMVSDGEPGGEPIEGIEPAIADRPTYKHSVIPGGAWDHRELAGAIERDSVVAQHYRDVDPATMQTEILKADRLAFVSYRMGDRIYWTKRKVRISAGETILTNGDTAIRARCGNCISLEPMLPIADDEPDPAELDALLDEDPVLASRNLSGVMAAPVGTGEDDPAGGEAPPLMLVPLTGAVSGGGPSETPAIIGAPDDFPSFEELVGDDPAATFPSPLFSTLLPGAPPFGPPPAIPPVDPPFTDFSDPFDDDPELFSPPADITPTPVPEPGTFVLLGSAMAGLLARRWRSTKHL